MSSYQHVPVLLNEVIEGLNLAEGMTVVDCTLGGGGHAAVLLAKIGNGKLYAFDQDQDAIDNAAKNLALDQRVTLIKNNFSFLKEELAKYGVDKINAVLFDLGVSSYQLDTAERGFSWNSDRLDMRMNMTEGKLTAAEIVNNYSEQELKRIFKENGEERYAGKIAAAIERVRKRGEIFNSGLQLKNVIFSAAVGNYQQKNDSVTRVFQALRIEVNGELAILEKSLRQAVELLVPGGRIAVISFHSLEDRIVKQVFIELSRSCVCPPSFPVCRCGKVSTLKIINKKPLTASVAELELNSRARSAKLRIAEKI